MIDAQRPPQVAVPISDEIRGLARDIYFAARQRGSEHYAALRTVGPMLTRRNEQRAAAGLPPDPLPDLPIISEWADEHAWPSQFAALTSDDFRQNLVAPDDQESRFQKRLDAARRAREMAALALDRVHAELDSADDDLSPAPNLTQDLLRRLQQAQSLYDNACRSEQKLEDEARKRLLEIPSGAVAAAAIREREKELLAHYTNLPPVYQHLCGQLAELTYRAEALRASGRDVSIEELTKLNGSILATVAQIQKHTESTKSESLSKDRNELALALMAVVERVVAPSQPNLWAAIFVAVKQTLQSRDGADPFAAALNAPKSVLDLLPSQFSEVLPEPPPPDLSEDDE